MRRSGRWSMLALAAAAGAALAVSAALPARAADAPTWDFETDVQGWTTTPAGGAVTVTQDAAHVKVGKAALEWTYDPAGDQPGVAIQNPQLKNGANTLDFWIRSTATAGFQLIFIQQDRAIHHLKFRVPAEQWQHVRSPLSDLTTGVGQSKSDSVDLEKTVLIMLEDLSRYSSDAAELKQRTTWIDGITFSGDIVGQRRYSHTVGGKEELFVDDFDGETVNWLGQTRIPWVLEKVDGHTAMKAAYRHGSTVKTPFSMEDHIDIRYGDAKAVRVVARASTATRLGISLMEFDGTYTGPSYLATVDIPAGGEWHTLTIPLSEFKLTDTKKDENEKLDFDKVWLFQVADRTDADGEAETVLELDSVGVLLN